MGEYTTMVGMDVHARSIACKALSPETGETWERSFSGDTMVSDLTEWARTLPQPVRLAYESGCTGYELCRTLRDAGLACDIAAVSTLPRSPKDRRRKNDRRDAGVILGEMCNRASKVSWCWVPDREVEGARDLARACAASSRLVVQQKQKISALLLKHGAVWNEKTPTGRRKSTWTREHRAWVASADLGDPLSNRALKLMLAELSSLEDEERAFAGAADEVCGSERWKPYVDAISMLMGVNRGGALLAAAEFGVFSRFPSGRKVSSWIGCTATEDSSGPKESRGGVTKEGPTLLRRALVEGNASMSRRSRTAKRAKRGHEVSPEVAALAKKANRRLKERYDALVAAGKPANVARVAVASEQARWIWKIGLQVESELAA